MIQEREKSGGKTALVEQEIRRQIDLGNFQRNSLLPSERELAKQMSVSYMTVRRAIGKLVDEEFLTRIHGKGTYIRGDVPRHRMQQTLGVIVPAWETPEHTELVMTISELAAQNELLPKFHFCRTWEDRTLRDACDSSDFLILVPPASLEELPPRELDYLRTLAKPLVIFGIDATRFGFDSVTGDSCTEAAVRELRRAGHRRIGLVTQTSEKNGKLIRYADAFYRNWFRLMKEEFTEKELEAMEVRIPVETYQLPHQAIYDYILVNGPELPVTALIISLSMAWGVFAAMTDTGLALPGRLSILVIGDRQESRFYRPRPSTIRVAYRRHIELAIEAIRRRQLDPDAVPRHFLVDPEYLPGDTVAPYIAP